MTAQLPYPPPWQDAATLCAHICISLGTLDTWVKEGRLPPARVIGGKRMWKWDEVNRMLAGDPGIVPSDADEAALARRVRNVTETASSR